MMVRASHVVVPWITEKVVVHRHPMMVLALPAILLVTAARRIVLATWGRALGWILTDNRPDDWERLGWWSEEPMD